MNKLKKIIIFLIIVMIVLVMMVLLIQSYKKRTLSYDDGDIDLVISDEIYEVQDETMYYTVTECLKKYYKMCLESDSNVYYLLSTEYIAKNSITINNVISKIESVEKNPTIKVLKEYILEDIEVETYIVKALINEEEKEFLINVDIQNDTFSIEPIEEMEISKEALQERKHKIPQKIYNLVEYVKVFGEEICSYYFIDYQNKVKLSPDEARKLLVDENGNILFENLKEFEEYIGFIKDKEMVISQENYNDEYREYTCYDDVGNKYIFHATSVMNYTLQIVKNPY